MSGERIAVVGPCAAGKSTLVSRLRGLGYDARHCAQEHSYVPDMWRRISRPRWLIYLGVSFSTINRRRLAVHFRPQDLAEQERRLAHAKQNCDFYIPTDDLTPDGILKLVLEFVASARDASQGY